MRDLLFLDDRRRQRRRGHLLRLACVLGALALAPAASAVVIDLVTIGDPGNPPDPDPATERCGATLVEPCGSVAYEFQIGRYEVSNDQYAEFLNAVAAADPHGLYSSKMGDVAQWGGISRSGSPGSYSYTPIPGRDQLPVLWTSFFDAMRFANWLHNGQPVGAQGPATTEDGAYTLPAGGDVEPGPARNAGALYFLPTRSEWYKATYYEETTGLYYEWPFGTDSATTCALPSASPNIANCESAVGDLTAIGAYTGSLSPSGIFDAGGNISEWNELIIANFFRGIGGGNWLGDVLFMRSNTLLSSGPTADGHGIRIAAAAPVCGNAILETGEDCDDGNTADGDCCSAGCGFETGQGTPACCSAGLCQVGQNCGAVCFQPDGICKQPGGAGSACTCGLP